MLPKQYRLKKNSAFKATYKVRNSSHKGGVTLYVGLLKKDLNQPTKVGFVVSKKTHKRAVRRNHLKRLMRESYRLYLKNTISSMSQKYLSLIFVGSGKALRKSFNDINFIVRELLESIK